MTRHTSAPLSTMSGNFDFPPASTSSQAAQADEGPSSTDPSNFTARFQHLRNVLLRDRERDRVLRDGASSTMERLRREMDTPPPPSLGGARRRRPLNRRLPPIQFASEVHDGYRQSGPQSSGIAGARNRPRATPSERYYNLRREREQMESSMADLERASEHLAELNSQLGHLRDARLSQERTADAGRGPRRRYKRRRLNDDEDSRGFRGVKYGHYGQVVPGRLNMDIVSCDGGEFRESPSLDIYGAQNILRNDKSVYCTKSSRCNILLRHQGETAFCLEKIVIKAPEQGFTAPVQEGMIFVSMSAAELQQKTSQYEIKYAPTPSPPRSAASNNSSQQDSERLTLLESLQDPEISAAAHRSRRSTDPDDMQRFHENRRARTRRLAQRMAEFRQWEAENGVEPLSTLAGNSSTSAFVGEWIEPELDLAPPAANVYIENCEPPLSPSPNVALPVVRSPPPIINIPTPPPFTVTTSSTDHEDSSSEEDNSAAILADRLRRNSRWRGASASDDEDDDLRHMSVFWDTTRHMHEYRPVSRAGYIRAAQRSEPSRIEPTSSSSASGVDGNEVGEGGEGDVLAPHARFFIRKNKNRISVKFHPPV